MLQNIFLIDGIKLQNLLDMLGKKKRIMSIKQYTVHILTFMAQFNGQQYFIKYQ